MRTRSEVRKYARDWYHKNHPKIKKKKLPRKARNYKREYHRAYYLKTHPHKRETHCKVCREKLPKLPGFNKVHARRIYCDDCKNKKYLRTYPHLVTGDAGVNSHYIGTISELRVCADLFLRGYYAFRALSPACPVDVIAWRNSKFYSFEVRTGGITPTGKIHVRTEKVAKRLAIVLRDQIIYDPPLPVVSEHFFDE